MPSKTSHKEPTVDYRNRFPQMLQINLMRRVREIEEQANSLKFGMKTRQDALEYQAALKRKMRKVFGPLPKRTPLNAEVTGSFERDAYRVEKVLFESRPGFPVTGLLYIPKRHELPCPGVLAPCGHSANGKACDAYQAFCQGLASKGYVVFQYDPMSQGERLQYPGKDGNSWVGGCCAEHNHAGRQQLLVGEFFGTWRAWDGIRACDYLLSRPEVDPTHLGITGNSGGGTLTTLICALDQRYTMAAPGCYVTTWRRNAENELPADAEQQPPFALRLGLDMDDFFGLHAPNPLILLTQELDYFDQRGAQEAYQRLRHLYRLLGAEDNVAIFTGEGHHGYAQPLREAMYGFFNKACGKTDETSSEPPVTIEPDETLWVTKTGQVADLKPRPKNVFSFTKESAEALAQERESLSGEALRKELLKLLNLPKRRGLPDYRILRQPGRIAEYPRPFATTYVVETEADIQAIVYKLEDDALASPVPPGEKAVLYVPHMSSDEDLRTDALARKLGADTDRAFFAVDPRGIGESIPNTCDRNSYLNIYGSDYFYASYGLMLGEPTLGRRTHDILAVLDWMQSYGYEDVHIVGRGWGSLPATFAAVLDERVTSVTLKNAPIAFSEWATQEDMRWPLSACLPCALRTLDLPDCYRELIGRNLRVLEPWNARMERLTRGAGRKLMAALGGPEEVIM